MCIRDRALSLILTPWNTAYLSFRPRRICLLYTSGSACEVELLQIGCTIAVHTGPYALGMGVMRRWKKQ